VGWTRLRGRRASALPGSQHLPRMRARFARDLDAAEHACDTAGKGVVDDLAAPMSDPSANC